MKLTLQFIAMHGDSLFKSLRWGKTATCPYCGSSHVYIGKSRYKCANCGKRFTAKTATLFHASNLSTTTIMMGIYLMMSNRGISSYIYAEQLGISQRSAWLLQTRIRLALVQRKIEGADIMADEAYIGGRVSNMHRKRKYQLLEEYEIPLGDNGKVPSRAIANAHTKHVMGIVDENKKVLLRYCPNGFGGQRAINLIYELAPNAEHVTTDESGLYLMFPDEVHSTVNHKEHVYLAKDGMHTTNGCENMFGWYKGQSDHNHRHYKRKYTQGYLNEFAFRRNGGTDTWDRMQSAFEIIKSIKKMTIKQITA